MAKKNTLSELSSFLKETLPQTNGGEKTDKTAFLEQAPKKLVETEQVNLKASNDPKNNTKKTMISEEEILNRVRQMAAEQDRSVEDVLIELMRKYHLEKPLQKWIWVDVLLQSHLTYLHYLHTFVEKSAASWGLGSKS